MCNNKKQMTAIVTFGCASIFVKSVKDFKKIAKEKVVQHFIPLYIKYLSKYRIKCTCILLYKIL